MKKTLAIIAAGMLAALAASCAAAPAAESESAPGTVSGARELSLPEKTNPGCRTDLPYPLKMTGPSSAVDFSRWSARDVDGNEVTQDILKESKITLISVWTTFCSTHVADMEIMQAIYEAYPREQVNVVGIPASAMNADGSIGENGVGYVKYMREQTGAAYPLILPSNDLIAIHLKDLKTMPETFILDGEGNMVVEPFTGPRTEEELRGTIDGALARLEETPS